MHERRCLSSLASMLTTDKVLHPLGRSMVLPLHAKLVHSRPSETSTMEDNFPAFSIDNLGPVYSQ